MYEIPSGPISKCVITKEMVEEHKRPPYHQFGAAEEKERRDGLGDRL